MAGEVRLEIDHIIPVSQGGTNDEENLTTACFDCNRGRGALPITGTFTQWLAMQTLRDDIVGDLADDHVRTPLRKPSTFKDLIVQLKGLGACREAEHAAWCAWREWRTGRPSRLVMRQRAELLEGVRATRTGDHRYWLKRGYWAGGHFNPYAKSTRANG